MDKITYKDWLLALGGLFFTLGGLLILQRDLQMGITTLAFFGPCFTVAIYTILRKLKRQRQSPLAVTVAGGVPIRPSRTLISLIGLSLLVVGTGLGAFQTGGNPILFGCALMLSVLGGVLLVGLACGRLPKTYIQFDPPGLTFGNRGGRVMVPWWAITDLARGEWQKNQAVFIGVACDAVTAEPPTYLARVRKQMASSRKWSGAEFVILSSLYGIDSPVLLAAIERYATSPQARAELGAMSLPANTTMADAEPP